MFKAFEGDRNLAKNFLLKVKDRCIEINTIEIKYWDFSALKNDDEQKSTVKTEFKTRLTEVAEWVDYMQHGELASQIRHINCQVNHYDRNPYILQSRIIEGVNPYY